MSHTYARVRRHPWLLLPVIALAIFSMFLVTTNILAQDNSGNGRVEMDGNVHDDGGVSPTDWDAICRAVPGVTTGNGYIGLQPSQPSGIAPAVCKGDSYLTATGAFGADNTYFASNKDIEDISGSITTNVWGCVDVNNPTPKDEIFNSYAAQGTVGSDNHVGLFLGFERGQNNGTEFQGAWFMKNKVGCVGPATGQNAWSGGPHASWFFDPTTRQVSNTCNAAGTPGQGSLPCNGDLLLIANHPSGGASTQIRAAAWDPNQACNNLDCTVSGAKKLPSWPLLPLEGPNDPDCSATNSCVAPNGQGADCQGPAQATICATSNDPVWNPTTPTDGCINTPWLPGSGQPNPCTTGGKGQNTPIIDSFQFVEGFIDLNAVFGEVPCFSTVLFEARTSAEFTATLKDYALGDFDTCGKIIIHKETDPEDVNYNFNYTTTGGNGLPSSFSLRDDGNNELGCDYSQATPATTDDCGTAGTVVYTGIVPGNYTVTETDPSGNTPPFDFARLTCQVNSGTATVTPLSPGSTSNRTATINVGILGVVECLYENRQRGSIFFEKVDEGSNLLGGATFTISPNPYGTGDLDVTDNGTNDSNSADGKFCLANVPFNSNYTITEKTAPPGYEKDPNSQSVSVQTTADCAAKETAGGFPVFTNKLGTIVIKKTDEGSNPLTGACFTLTPDPKTGSGTLRVCDNPVSNTAPADQQADGANDTDPTVGTICITGARLNASGEDYDIVESVTPAGYEPDSTTHHVTVSDSKGCATTTATTTFVNKLGTIVIKKTDEGSNPLTGACFTLTPDPKTGTGTLRVCDNPVSNTAPADQQADGANDTDPTVGTICITGARLNASGEDYDIVESVTPAGYEKDSTTHHVTVSDSKGCATTTATTTFVNKLGSLLIHKISAKTGNPEVAGSCFTLTPDPGSTPPGTGTLVVCDKDAAHTGANTTPDTDNRTGFVCVTGVKLNSYSITESTVPAGYALGSITPNDGTDTKTGVITVSDSTSCADRETAGGSLVITAVNVPLSEISVLFKSLAGPGVTTATIDCKEEGAALNLPFIFAPVSDLINGAAADLKKLYGDNTTNPGLLPGTYVCTVVIDP